MIVTDPRELIRLARKWRRAGYPEIDWPCDGYGRPLNESAMVLAAMTRKEMAAYGQQNDIAASFTTLARARIAALTGYLNPRH